MFEKRAVSDYPLLDAIDRRWSGRAYDPSRPLARDTLGSLLEAARWAPSCFGDQPWSYLVWDRFTDKESWRRAWECLAEGNRVWAENAAVLMLATARKGFRRNDQANRWSQYDTGAASENLVVQATALGLMSHQMGGFDADEVRQRFSIPGEFTCMAMIAIGYQLPEAEITDELREREYGERSRLPLTELMFEGAWGKPVRL
jgi:nitroreductase